MIHSLAMRGQQRLYVGSQIRIHEKLFFIYTPNSSMNINAHRVRMMCASEFACSIDTHFHLITSHHKTTNTQANAALVPLQFEWHSSHLFIEFPVSIFQIFIKISIQIHIKSIPVQHIFRAFVHSVRVAVWRNSTVDSFRVSVPECIDRVESLHNDTTSL